MKPIARMTLRHWLKSWFTDAILALRRVIAK